MPIKSYTEKEQRYWEHRNDARVALLPSLKEEFGLAINLSDINAEAIRQAESWTNLRGDIPNPKWAWTTLVNRARRRCKRIELAIWVGDQLCGLMLGRISDRKVTVSIHYLQRNPNNSLLRGQIADIAVQYLDALGIILGSKESAVMNPDPNLIEYYNELGFTTKVEKGKRVTRLLRKY